MISMRNVTKTFDKPLLNGVDLDVEKGSKVSIIGGGGCGKSTVLKLILGIVSPDDGAIRLMGQDMVQGSESEKQVTLRKVGMAFQQGALFDYMTVGENLMFAMENMTDFTHSQMDEKIDYLLDSVKLGRTRHMYPYELSGGMQRRVGIARALATEPTVSIFDEPTAGLDPVTSTIILNMINNLGGIERGNTLVVATSSVEIAIRFSERVMMMKDGRIVADGSWKDLILNGDEWVRHFLGVRLIGIDLGYAIELGLPEPFILEHWKVDKDDLSRRVRSYKES